MKSYTDIEQSKKLAEILPVETADMYYMNGTKHVLVIPNYETDFFNLQEKDIPCWSLAVLLSLIKDKCGYFELVYLKRTSDGRANLLEDVYRLSTDVYDMYKKDAVDACCEMIVKLHEQKLL